jgi:hypothetical protein
LRQIYLQHSWNDILTKKHWGWGYVPAYHHPTLAAVPADAKPLGVKRFRWHDSIEQTS